MKGTPEDRDTYITLANMYARLKRYPEAEDAANHAVQLSTKSEDKDDAQFTLASIYEREKKYDQSEQLFKQLINSNPSNAAALNYLGYTLADRGLRLDEALGYTTRAVQLEPQNGAYWTGSDGLISRWATRHGRRLFAEAATSTTIRQCSITSAMCTRRQIA